MQLIKGLTVNLSMGSLLELRTRLYDDFDRSFIWFLVVVYGGIKGMSLSLLNSAMMPMFQRLGIGGTDFQLASMIARVPWALKGWIGLLSDGFPLGRYHKRGYLLASAALGLSSSAALLNADSLGVTEGSKWFLAVLFLVPQLQYATFDLLTEGKYTELMRKEDTGSEIISLVWVCISLGGLFAALLSAGLVDTYGAQPLIALSLVPAVYAGWLALHGYMPESVIPERHRGIQWTKLASEPWLFSLAFFMALGSFVLAVVAAIGSSACQLVVTIVVPAGLVMLSFRALPRTLAKSNLYMFLVFAAYWDLSGPLGYYYTAQPACVPDGPHFSYSYYIGVAAIVGGICSSFGSVVFQVMNHWTFRQAFRLTTLIQVFAATFDLAIVMRWNVALGFSDAATYIFGDAAIQSLAYMLQVMPGVLLTVRLCPRGAEATGYAILSGFQCFGINIASVLGALLSRHLGIHGGGLGVGDKSLSCSFEQLPLAILVSHIVLPLAVLPLTCCLVPSVRMDDELAFAGASPPPSFASSPMSSRRSSPATSPSLSPLHSPLGHDGKGDDGYFVLPAGPFQNVDEQMDASEDLRLGLLGVEPDYPAGFVLTQEFA